MQLQVPPFDLYGERNPGGNRGQHLLNYQRNLDRPVDSRTEPVSAHNCMAHQGRLRLKLAEKLPSLSPSSLLDTFEPVRWSLRNQILLPMAGLMLVTLLGVSALNVYLAVQRTRSQIESQLRDVTQTIVEAAYPLTDNVLRQMHGLSGAELVVVGEAGQRLAGSATWDVSELPPGDSIDSWTELKLGEPVGVAGQRYFHSVLNLARNNQATGGRHLHVFYPESRYSEAVWDAVLPPIVVGTIALVMIMVLAHWFASRLTRPIGQLQRQVKRISQGEFVPMTLPERNDELRDLSLAVNRMSELLANYEDEVRRSEQLRTLGILRGGIAHQMRNAVTGCRMALDLHGRAMRAQSSMTAEDAESLDVALRQLSLIEQQLQKFLSEQQAPLVTAEVNLAEFVSGVLPLISPAAIHLGVELCWEPPEQSFLVKADVTALEQLTGNLLLNALDATASAVGQKRVRIELSQVGERSVALTVLDNGQGPSQQISGKLFEPLVTDKRGGTGLGLSVVREVAQQHGGNVSWQRVEGWTCFRVELPLVVEEQVSV
jgi:signal transduction histidine kinase